VNSISHPGDALSRRQRLVYVLLLGALTALGPFTIDLYLPAFPMLEQDLGVSSAAIQLTLSATMMGFALGQLIVGPLSDKVGRRRPLLIATTIHVASSLGAVFAPDFAWLAAFRVVQGLSTAAGGVVAMAMVRDLFSGHPLVRMLSRMALVSGVAPIIAPVIGSQLLLVTDWRGIFVFLAAYGAVVAIASYFFIVETLPPERRIQPGHSSAGQRYKAIFTDRIYVGVVIVASMNFTGLFAYLSSSPFLFQDVYQFTEQEYGLLFAVNSVGIVLGVQTSSRLTRRWGPQWILVIATLMQLTSASAIVIGALAGAGLPGIVVPLWFFIFSCGLIFPCAQVLALMNHGREAGTAASVLGAANFGVAALLSPLVGLFSSANAIPMAVTMVAAVLASIAALWLIVRPRTVPALR
jgi:DHA1 family bicyclomycin/chloramphenicol resistance-like MFS transporter